LISNHNKVSCHIVKSQLLYQLSYGPTSRCG
jgi:hypothetical protein